MDHAPLGQAELNPSPNNDSLKITNIGDTGNDGVAVQLAESQFLEFEFEDPLDPSLLPAGTTVTLEPRSAGAGALNPLGSVTLIVNDQQQLGLTADFSNFGSDTYSLSILNNGVGVWNGGPYTPTNIWWGLLLNAEIYMDYTSTTDADGNTTTTWGACVRTGGTISPPDGGPTVIGDTIMITPDVPSSVTGPPTEVALLVSGIDSLTIARTSQKFNGIEVFGTGSARLESYETTSGTLEVSGIGPSGLDGFAVNTANTSYDEITLTPDTAIEPNPGAVVALRSLDDGGGERGAMRAEANAAGQWGFSAEFQGSDTYSMKVFNGGELVYEASGLTGIGASTAGKPIGFYQNLGVTDGGCILCGLLDGLFSIATSTGDTVTGNAIQFINDTPISGCSTALVLGGANLPPFAVVNVWDGGGSENCSNGIDDDGDGLVDGDDPDCGCIPIDLPPFTIGDPNGDGSIDIGDAVGMLGYLFGGSAISCLAAMDVNGDHIADISDPIYELSYLFGAGAPPVGGGECTPDPDHAVPALECESSGCP
jgi:hypothetical protein